MTAVTPCAYSGLAMSSASQVRHRRVQRGAPAPARRFEIRIEQGQCVERRERVRRIHPAGASRAARAQQARHSSMRHAGCRTARGSSCAGAYRGAGPISRWQRAQRREPVSPGAVACSRSWCARSGPCLRVDDEHRGNRQLVMRRALGFLEIEAVGLVFGVGGVVHAEGDAERARGIHLAVETTGGSRRAPCRLERRISGRSVLRNNTSNPSAETCGTARSQVLEMRIAVGTPAAAIEDEHRGLRQLFRLEPERLAIGFRTENAGAATPASSGLTLAGSSGDAPPAAAATARVRVRSTDVRLRVRCITWRPAVCAPYFSTCEALAGIRGGAHV